MVSVHSPTPVGDFCAPLPDIETKPVFRVPIGGGQIEPPVDATKGKPGSCSLTLSLMGDMQTALASIQPVLTILDTVATMAQCVLLTGEVYSNPLKIPDLLACIPNLVAKVNQLLALVPSFPQGYAKILTSIVDVLQFATTLLDCLVDQLTAVQDALTQLERDIEALTTLPEGPVRSRMEELIACGVESAQDTIATSTATLGPIARLLCVIRSIVALQGDDGKKLAKQLGFPDLSDPESLDVAIDALSIVRDVLQLGIDIVTAIGAPLGAPEAPPDLVFTCPLDEGDALATTEEREAAGEVVTLPTPAVTDVLNADTGVSLGSPPVFPVGGPDLSVVIVGTNFINTDQSIPYWGTAPLSGSQVIGETQVKVTIPSTLQVDSGTFYLSVVNQPAGGAVTPFSGLTDPASGESTENEIKPSPTLTVSVV